MVANVTVRLPVVHEPGSFLMSLVVLFKFLNRICAFAPSRSVSLLTSGPKRPAKADKNGVKKTSTIVPVGNYSFLQYKHGLLFSAVLLLGIYGHQYDTNI